jgi:shikimate dehydrogenase
MGLQNQTLELSSELFAAKFIAYDMMYGATDTAFMLWAKSVEADLVLDGLGMLVEQAAESFTLWRGVRPHTKGVILKLRNEL